MKVLDLFSGIGGFSLGLERAGMTTVAFCEIEEYPRKVLNARWPHVPCYRDVRELTASRLARDGIGDIDLICGGFPCQDISLAGKGAGLTGARSGLWFEYRRLIEEVAPRWVIIENVSALRSRGLDVVLGQIAALGYDAEWHCIPASAVGAPHRRDRIWIVAYLKPPRSENVERRSGSAGTPRGQVLTANIFESRPRQWLPEPQVVRVVDELSAAVDAIGALGNAVVPQIPEMIGRAIMQVGEMR